MTCEMRNKEINSQCAELLVRPLYKIHSGVLIIFLSIPIMVAPPWYLSICTQVDNATHQCYPAMLPISATQQCYSAMLPSNATHQCYPAMLPSNATHQCYPAMLPINATHQCYPAMLPSNATHQCYPAMLPINATQQCYPSMLPSNATQQCYPSMLPINATQQCYPAMLPINATQQCYPSMLPSNATHQCYPAMLPSNATQQCYPAMLPINATQQCYPAMLPSNATHQPDVIVLNETWLKDSIQNSELFPNRSYKIFRLDRSPVSHPPHTTDPKKFRSNGGGVMIAINSSLVMKVKQLKTKVNAEILYVTLTLKNSKKLCITTCYRVGTLQDRNFNEISNHIYNISSRV